MVGSWTLIGATVAGWIVLLGIVLLSPATPPPVDRGHACDSGGCNEQK